MSIVRVFVDHNAGTTLRPEAREAVLAAMDRVGNPSSVHREGREVRAILEDARECVAAMLAADPAGVVLTSGGTEANAMAIAAGWQAIALTRTEHPSVIEAVKASGARILWLAVDGDGVVDVAEAGRQMAMLSAELGGRGRALLSLALANGETGVVQDVGALAAIARTLGIAVHCDAVQAPGRMAVRIGDLGVDMLSVSGHKIGGPKGVGALVLGEGVEIPPLIRGGGQERRRRSGTEAVPAIAGFGAAAAALADEAEGEARLLAALRDELERGLIALAPGAVVIGRGARRLPNTTMIGFPGRRSDLLVVAFDLAGAAVSAGSACSSGKVGRSHVLEAMGVPGEIAGGAVRFSLGWSSGESDVARLLEIARAVVGRTAGATMASGMAAKPVAAGEPRAAERNNLRVRSDRRIEGVATQSSGELNARSS